jgi:hypothetical protein
VYFGFDFVCLDLQHYVFNGGDVDESLVDLRDDLLHVSVRMMSMVRVSGCPGRGLPRGRMG